MSPRLRAYDALGELLRDSRFRGVTVRFYRAGMSEWLAERGLADEDDESGEVRVMTAGISDPRALGQLAEAVDELATRHGLTSGFVDSEFSLYLKRD